MSVDSSKHIKKESARNANNEGKEHESGSSKQNEFDYILQALSSLTAQLGRLEMRIGNCENNRNEDYTSTPFPRAGPSHSNIGQPTTVDVTEDDSNDSEAPSYINRCRRERLQIHQYEYVRKQITLISKYTGSEPVETFIQEIR